ncbi:hypothetical protein CHRY9390_00406 [Chryseobacterium aquaeductus]|uniref:YARHG domain-containing protein n=2 Tax=Chryseobacterium aquaeductus TaxID=2675056 RepID=A0A9N8MEI3_9FLAO|nr:hypothetical protein CHRY9390_00406 [Chryseobacterium potabilaquae]CAD7798911.1 hypothetical protein CHRY9390_00406 [Chryseobacterium aquaeductus]
MTFQNTFSQKQKSYSVNYLDDLSLFYLLDAKKVFAEESLAYLTKTELKYLRNLPYARKGMIFKDEALTQYFKKYPWYNPTKNNIDENELNPQEKHNIDKILLFENAIIIPTSDVNYQETLSGYWQLYTTTVADNYDDIFVFSNLDKSFSFYKNENNKKEILREYSGWFAINIDKIELDISHKIIMQKFYKKDRINPISKKHYKNAEYRRKEINLDDAHEFSVLPISEITLLTLDGIDKSFVKIDGKVYWKIVYEIREGC